MSGHLRLATKELTVLYTSYCMRMLQVGSTRGNFLVLFCVHPSLLLNFLHIYNLALYSVQGDQFCITTDFCP